MILASVSVVLVLVVGGVAVLLGPAEARLLFLVSGLLALLMAAQAAFAEPRDLGPALILAAVPVMALAAGGSPSGLVVSLGVLLFVACELNALSWRMGRPGTRPHPTRQQLLDTLRITVIGAVGAGIVLGIAVIPVPGSTMMVALAALVLAVGAAMVFRPGRQRG
ncbi:MAG: hypothetical protein EA350_07575 [Gemmatimonadales bacterium]|nr:MAG: hypothetical protein EA350_07575 [Gemmatimonadales bacterium]